MDIDEVVERYTTDPDFRREADSAMGVTEAYGHCCICDARLLYRTTSTEGGLKRMPYCPIHSTRGTQHLRG